jgi:Fumarylacetoacetate (FAA) hydrolase family
MRHSAAVIAGRYARSLHKDVELRSQVIECNMKIIFRDMLALAEPLFSSAREAPIAGRHCAELMAALQQGNTWRGKNRLGNSVIVRRVWKSVVSRPNADGTQQMKLVRWGKAGRERPGIVDADGKIRDLSGLVADIGGEALSRKSLSKLSKVRLDKLPLVRGRPRLGPCVGQVPNFIAVGLNYADHAAETGAAIPDEPILFNKHTSCIVGPNDEVMIPKGSVKTDWEVELAIVIGEKASYVGEREALDYVAGYCICNDVSEREYQLG